MAENKGGRPTIYNEQLTSDIISRMMAGESVRSIARDPDMPHASTIFKWVIDGEHKEFTEQYDHARSIQAEFLAEEIFSIADNLANPELDEDGNPTNQIGHRGFDKDDINLARLRIDSRKWYLSKIVPRFKDKSEIDLNVKEMPTIKVVFAEAEKAPKKAKKKTEK